MVFKISSLARHAMMGGSSYPCIDLYKIYDGGSRAHTMF